MYYLQEGSLQTETPIFQRLDSQNTYLFPEFVIARDFASKGVYEKSIIDWAKQFVNPNQVFVDIGAHVGTYALSFAPHVREVYAFECSPRTYNFLCANIALRGLDFKINPIKVALGNADAVVDYYIRSSDGGGNGVLKFESDTTSGSIQLPMKTLDSFHIENIGLIKIDVEGFEKQVLQGSLETLRRNNYPKLLFESWAPHRTDRPSDVLRNELFEFIESIGYKIVPIRGWDEMFLAEFSSEHMISIG